MKVKTRKIAELIPAEYNPRALTDKERADLRGSLERFGIVDPIIVNTHAERSNIIVGGHQRCMVWESMGNDTIPTVEVNLTEAQERELNIRLNKNTGHWDYDALTEYFDQELLTDWGFSDFEFTPAEDVNLDEFFDEDNTQEKEETFKITLEFTEEDYNKVIDAFDSRTGSREAIIFELLEL